MLKILGIGEAIWDVYSDTERYPGGVPVNFTVHASQLGHRGILLSRVAADAAGDDLRAELTRRGVETELLQVDPEMPTAEVLLKIGVDGIPDFVCRQKSRAFHHLQKQSGWTKLQPDAIVFTVLGQLSPAAGSAIQQYLESSTAFKLLDANAYFISERTIKVVKESLERANGLKLNSRELRILAEITGLTESEPIPELMQRFKLDLVMHTQGAGGAELYTRNQKYQIAALNSSPRDTNGCGDAFAAAALILYLQNRPIEEIALAASQLAAFVARNRGAVPFYQIHDHEIDQLF